MLDALIAWCATWIVPAIAGAGYPSVVALMAVESACIPLPSEIIMPFAGYLVSTGRFTLIGAATAGALGCNIGSALAYWVGARGGRPMVEKWGRYILLSPHDIALADRFFARWGGPAVFIARLLPVVRTFIALPAGIARMPQVPFHLYTFVGSWIWCYALAYIGYALGERWNANSGFRAVLHQIDYLIVGLGVAIVAWWVWRHLRRTR
ncbi:MAG: DedA family protein [Alphaproteobacteria bacterium]|nr:DedA family protein [Alphaproteobacteria bacterium]